jgi:Tol biopolymer transport system component
LDFNSMSSLRRQRGGTLGKVILLLFFIGLAVGFWIMKARMGTAGETRPLTFDSKDHVAFLRQDDNGQANLFIVKLDGTGEQRLTSDASPKQGLTWAPDGKQLCYSAEVRDETLTAYQLFRFGSDGSHPLTYGSGSKHMPEWQPNGKQIGYLASGALKVINPNGEGNEQVYPHMHKGGSGEEEGGEEGSNLKRPPLAYFHWSPDSASIAAVMISEGEQLQVQGNGKWFKGSGEAPDETAPVTVAEPETMLVLSAAGGEPTIRRETNSLKVGFSWLPDGKRIAVTMSTRSALHGIAIIRADDERLPAVSLFASAKFTVSAENPSVSPDGSKLAFEVWRIDSTENRDLMGIAVMPIEGQPLIIRSVADISKVPLIVKGRTTNPSWTKDGGRLIYQVTGTSGKRDIWCVGADGKNPVNLTNGKGDNFDAVASPAK